MVAEHGHHRDGDVRELVGEQLGLVRRTELGQVAGEHQHIGLLVHVTEVLAHVTTRVGPDVKVADGGDPHVRCSSSLVSVPVMTRISLWTRYPGSRAATTCSAACSSLARRHLSLEVHVVVDDAGMQVECRDLGIGGEGVLHQFDDVVRRLAHPPGVPRLPAGQTRGRRVGAAGCGYPGAMPPQQGEHLIDALKRVAAVLRDAKIEFALGGGMAAWALGGPPTEHDVDLAIRERDVEVVLRALAEAGLPTEEPPEGWLVKTWVDGVLVDLIFRPSGLVVDDEFLASCDELSVAAVTMRVMPASDIMRTKLLALSEHNLDLEPLLAYARSLREQIDWDELASSVQDSPFACAFLALTIALDVAPAVGLPSESPVAQPAGATAISRSQ